MEAQRFAKIGGQTCSPEFFPREALEGSLVLAKVKDAGRRGAAMANEPFVHLHLSGLLFLRATDCYSPNAARWRMPQRPPCWEGSPTSIRLAH